MKKIYIVRKIVVADTPSEAIRKEKYEKVFDVFVDEASYKENVHSEMQKILKNKPGF